MSAAGHNDEDARLFDAVKAVGMELCPALGITIPVGKDSLSMRTEWENKSVTAPMSLIISAFSPVSDVRLGLTPQLQTGVDNQLLLVDLGAGRQRLGGSILAQVYNRAGGEVADVNNAQQLKNFFNAIQQLLADGLLLAYHDRSDGGLLATLAEMAFAGRCGVNVELAGAALPLLFNEELGAVLQVAAANTAKVEAVLAAAGLGAYCHRIGQATATETVRISVNGKVELQQSRADLQALWSQVSYFMQAQRDNPQTAAEEFARIHDKDTGLSAHLSFDVNDNITAPMLNTGARPVMAVLREQGVNGQLEMAAAFDRAGFASKDVHMRRPDSRPL